MPDNYSVAIETGGYRLLELFAERCGDDAAVTITDGDGHQIASHAMPVAERRHRFLIPVPTSVCPRLLDLGNKIMIGKGKRDAAVKEAVVRNGAVYLAALGGAGALMAQSVKTLEVIAWPDLGCEAVRRLTVEKMPLTVILDAHGGDLYTSGPAAYLETVK